MVSKIALIGASLSPYCASAYDNPTHQPNIVIVMTDDQGYGDVGIHGNDRIRTPNIDKFANDGVRLSRFYCSPVCAPTRASLMTGRYYYRSGVIHTSRGGAKMAGDNVTIAEMLSDAGYVTGIFGKWHLGDTYPMRPQDQGFQHSLVHKGGGIGQTPDQPNSYFDSKLWRNGREYTADSYCTDVFFDHALNFIEQYCEQPFFVYIPTNAPHTPLEIADEYVQPYRDRLRKEYEDWFADVHNSRQFTPGTIVIGSEAERSTVLCRYQDGNFDDGFAHGWSVQIIRPGRYKAEINRGDVTTPAVLNLTWQGETRTKPLAAGAGSAQFDLPIGEGVLDIWLQEPGRDRVRPGDNSTVGDVVLTRLEDR